MRVLIALFLFCCFIPPHAQAQEPLPGFSASLQANGKVLISWRNGYPQVNQISIQRSTDSLHNFVTLLTVPDPRIPENGFVDGKANGTKMYYRLFILLPNSKYLFTKSKRASRQPAEQSVALTVPVQKEKQPESPRPAPAVKDVSTHAAEVPIAKTEKPQEDEQYLVLPKIDNSRIYYMMETPAIKRPAVNNPGKIKALTIEVDKILIVKRKDSVIMRLPGNQVRRFSDSLVKQTKDTLYFVDADTLQIKPYVEVYREPKEVYKISAYVFTAKDGNVMIKLPDYQRKKYFVAFYEMDSTQVMDIKDIRDAELTIDKTNFGHSGWFRFELYEDGKLKEKNKFLIPKD